MNDYHYYEYNTKINYKTTTNHYRLTSKQQHNTQTIFNLNYIHKQNLDLKQINQNQIIHSILNKLFYFTNKKKKTKNYSILNLKLT